jgi:hypothetical protein
MKSFLSIAVLALISSTDAIHHRAMNQASGHAKGDSKNKDINTEGVDPYVWELASPSVDEAGWSRPAQPPARSTYLPYSADTYKPKEAAVAEGAVAAESTEATASPAAAEGAAPEEGASLIGLYQNGVYRPVYAMPNGQMMIQEEPAAEEAKAEEAAPAKEGEAAPAKEGEAAPAKEGEEAKEEKKEEKKDAEAKEGDEVAKSLDGKSESPNAIFDGGAWT